MRNGRTAAYIFFLMSSIVILLYFTGVSFVTAQGNLPAIIKKTQPSVVVILTYNKEGKLLPQ